MLRETLEGLALRPGDYAIDCTFGRGGHSRAVLDAIGRDGRLLALDKDPDAVGSEQAQRLLADGRFSIEQCSFGELRRCAESAGWLGKVAGVLMDLGVSSPQLDDAERGFSFLRNGPLDMRMDTGRGVTAAAWLLTVPENELAGVLREYGEERYARRIARAIVEHRSQRPLATTGELAELIEKAVPTREQAKHPATRSFQAIRIALNRELEELERGLEQAVDVLRPGGRLVVIAFHSLEDRIVKRFMRDQEKGPPGASRLPFQPSHTGTLKRIGKAALPTEEEALDNPRARSAVLRVAERLGS
jgi:16S rRNA (cytosine1402-N4)-methyltransferase